MGREGRTCHGVGADFLEDRRDGGEDRLEAVRLGEEEGAGPFDDLAGDRIAIALMKFGGGQRLQDLVEGAAELS